MKRMLGLLLLSLDVAANAADQGSSATDALEKFQRIIQSSVRAKFSQVNCSPKIAFEAVVRLGSLLDLDQ